MYCIVYEGRLLLMVASPDHNWDDSGAALAGTRTVFGHSQSSPAPTGQQIWNMSGKKPGKTLVVNVLLGMKVCILQFQNSRIEGIEIWRYRSEHHHYWIIASSWWMMWENIWEDLTKIFDVRLEFGAILLLVWFWLWFVPILWWTLLRYLVTVTARLLSRIKHSRLIEQSFYTTSQHQLARLNEAQLNRQDNVPQNCCKN